MHPQVEFLLQQPQPEQRTKEWYEARQSKVTASAVSNLLVRDENTCKQYVELYGLQDIFDYNNKSCNQYSSKHQFTLDKCKNSFTSSQATVWGNKYESVALDVYSKNNGNVKLFEFGLISHKSIPWLAASPDSITENGVMVEIKCPFRRKISGIPCLTYYQQVQIQLEVCDLEECDFAEYEFKEVSSLSDFIIIENNESGEPVKDKGIFIQVEDVPLFDKRSYYYPEKELINDVKKLNEWADQKIEEIIESKGLRVISCSIDSITCCDKNLKKTCIRKIYWKVMLESVLRIKRSREWFNDIKSTLKKEWDDVIYYRDNVFPYQEETDPKKEKRGEKVIECLF